MTWSPRSKEGVIRDIQAGAYSYFVKVGRRRITIMVVLDGDALHLRTDPNWTAQNRLLDLPDC